MSNLSYLEKLLDGGEVEWLPLGEVTELKRGKRLVKSQLESTGQFAVYQNSMTPLGYYHQSNTNPDTTFVICAGAAGEVGYSAAPFWAADDVHYINSGSQLDSKYLYHFILTQKGKILSHVRRASIPRLSKTVLDKLLVPIPCPDNPEKSLAIQSEIVRILDKFTALTAELTAELNMRKKQYNYYRDQLLSFEEGEVEWKTLGEVALIQRGASPRPIAQYITDSEDGIPWIKIGDTSPGSKFIENTAQRVTLNGAQKSRILKPGDFVISNSMSFGRPYILKITGAIHDGWASISGFEKQLDSDYLYHYLSSNKVQNYWEGKINSGSVSNLNADIIKALPIPLVTKQQQRQVAKLLDKFDTLTSSISEGLPREIELRQKQYEYYRDLLLNFPKSHSNEVA
ncbi:restriction endonuclease subunit S [Providencia huaxiensis]|uniref:restriction endonuclease subunit S n=1 Tax=Providencia huaxiensis TaxID=2027290 RepID=UPI003330A939